MSAEFRDPWLYGTRKETRKRVLKSVRAANSATGGSDPASDSVYRLLMEDPRERARLIHHGTERDPQAAVQIIKRGKDDSSEPPTSRQLRDPFTTFYVQGIALEPPLPPDRMLNLTEENPLHSGCLMAKATDACGRGWEFQPRDGKKSDKDAIQSEVPEKLKTVLEDITPDLTFTELLYQAAWEKEAIGWSVWEVVRRHEQGWKPGSGKQAPIGAIYPLPAHTLRATLDPRKWVQIRAGRVRYFKQFGASCEVDNENGKVYEWTSKKDKTDLQNMDPEFLASEVIIFKDYTPRSIWYGVPRWVAAIPTIAEMGAIREFNVSWFASGGQTDFALFFKATNYDTALKMRDDAQRQMQENAGRGHTHLLVAGDDGSDVKAEKMGELLREGHFRFRRQDLAKEILIAHNVPPYRVGWAEIGALAGNAAAEMLNAYKFGAIMPLQNVICDRLRQTLFSPDVGINTDKFRLVLHDLTLEEWEAMLDKAKVSVTTGIATPNQGREILGMDPEDSEKHPEMDVHYFNGTPLQAPPDPSQQAMPGAGAPPLLGPDGQPLPPPTDEPPQPGQPGQPGQPRPKPGQPGSDGFPPNPDEQLKSASALDVIERFERTLKEITSGDPIEPPTRSRRRIREPLPSATTAGPARGDKPNL